MALSALLSSDALSGIGSAAGVSASDAKNVLSAALPSLMDGIKEQATGANAASFAQALTQHAGADTSDLTGFLKNVDLKDGAKIISHLLGSNAQGVISSIAGQTGVSQEGTSNVLSAAAPLAMSLLGNENSGKPDLGSLVSGLLGNKDAAGAVTNLLGGLFGKK